MTEPSNLLAALRVLHRRFPMTSTLTGVRPDQPSPVAIRGRVLIVAYHFPPQAGSSGLLRSLNFCRYLPEFGWLPTVLTIDPRAYERTDGSQLAEVPASVNVIRAFGLDSHRHLSLGGRYLRTKCAPRSLGHLAGRRDSRRAAQHQEA